MAPRTQNLIPQHQRGADVQKHKAVAGNGGVKGALKNIANNFKNVNRPTTRRFGAKFCPNAQIDAMAAPNKQQVTLLSDDQVAAKKQVTPSPKQSEIIDLDPESDMGPKPMSISAPRTRNREVHSDPQVDEIDLLDVNNQLAVVEYVEDMYKFYKQQQHVARPIDYMDKQPDINPKMRAVLVDWIIEVHNKFKLMPETLYLTTYVIDRYLSVEIVPRRQLQLVGICALLIACKYEERRTPLVSDLVHITDNAYSRMEILGQEKEILNKLGWYLTIPTAYVFLVRFVKAAKADKELEHMIYFFAELGLMQYDLIRHCPSMIAASAVYAAQCTLNRFPLWTDTLQRHTSYSEHQLIECAQVLVNAHIAAPKSRLKVVYKKYILEQFGGVACYLPAGNLMERLKSSVSSSS